MAAAVHLGGGGGAPQIDTIAEEDEQVVLAMERAAAAVTAAAMKASSTTTLGTPNTTISNTTADPVTTTGVSVEVELLQRYHLPNLFDRYVRRYHIQHPDLVKKTHIEVVHSDQPAGKLGALGHVAANTEEAEGQTLAEVRENITRTFPLALPGISGHHTSSGGHGIGGTKHHSKHGHASLGVGPPHLGLPNSTFLAGGATSTTNPTSGTKAGVQSRPTTSKTRAKKAPIKLQNPATLYPAFVHPSLLKVSVPVNHVTRFNAKRAGANVQTDGTNNAMLRRRSSLATGGGGGGLKRRNTLKRPSQVGVGHDKTVKNPDALAFVRMNLHDVLDTYTPRNHIYHAPLQPSVDGTAPRLPDRVITYEEKVVVQKRTDRNRLQRKSLVAGTRSTMSSSRSLSSNRWSVSLRSMSNSASAAASMVSVASGKDTKSSISLANMTRSERMMSVASSRFTSRQKLDESGTSTSASASTLLTASRQSLQTDRAKAVHAAKLARIRGLYRLYLKRSQARWKDVEVPKECRTVELNVTVRNCRSLPCLLPVAKQLADIKKKATTSRRVQSAPADPQQLHRRAQSEDAALLQQLRLSMPKKGMTAARMRTLLFRNTIQKLIRQFYALTPARHQNVPDQEAKVKARANHVPMEEVAQVRKLQAQRLRAQVDRIMEREGVEKVLPPPPPPPPAPGAPPVIRRPVLIPQNKFERALLCPEEVPRKLGLLKEVSHRERRNAQHELVGLAARRSARRNVTSAFSTTSNTSFTNRSQGDALGLLRTPSTTAPKTAGTYDEEEDPATRRLRRIQNRPHLRKLFYIPLPPGARKGSDEEEGEHAAGEEDLDFDDFDALEEDLPEAKDGREGDAEEEQEGSELSSESEDSFIRGTRERADEEEEEVDEDEEVVDEEEQDGDNVDEDDDELSEGSSISEEDVVVQDVKSAEPKRRNSTTPIPQPQSQGLDGSDTELNEAVIEETHKRHRRRRRRSALKSVAVDEDEQLAASLIAALVQKAYPEDEMQEPSGDGNEVGPGSTEATQGNNANFVSAMMGSRMIAKLLADPADMHRQKMVARFGKNVSVPTADRNEEYEARIEAAQIQTRDTWKMNDYRTIRAKMKERAEEKRVLKGRAVKETGEEQEGVWRYANNAHALGNSLITEQFRPHTTGSEPTSHTVLPPLTSQRSKSALNTRDHHQDTPSIPPPLHNLLRAASKEIQSKERERQSATVRQAKYVHATDLQHAKYRPSYL